MIKVQCFSAEAQFSNESWPKNLCCAPSIGQTIQSTSGINAKIIEIIHCEIFINDATGYQPFLKLQLQLRF
jgi:hypothetical protein